MHPSVLKAELREAMLERIRRMNDDARAAESRSIVRRLLELLPTSGAICAFCPLKTEPDIRPLLAEILKRNQPLYLPAAAPSNGTGVGRLTMRRVRGLAELATGPFGIAEPPQSAPALPSIEPVIVLIPGRAFDAKGDRMGRGNGGYDRWITEHRKVNDRSRYYGVAFDCQIVTVVPMEAHDAVMDGVVTGRGLVGAD